MFTGGNPDRFLISVKGGKEPVKITSDTITSEIMESNPLNLIDFKLELSEKCLLAMYICGWASRRANLSSEELNKILNFMFDINDELRAKSKLGNYLDNASGPSLL